jgi:hypothetical protein
MDPRAVHTVAGLMFALARTCGEVCIERTATASESG